jgi:glycosyltransferase involved in cell wall biosynthesis
MKAFLVIVPLYNKIQFLAHTLPSILNQNDVWVEVVIVDDASTDGSYEWCVENLQGRPNVHILRNKKNIGCYQSRNVALKYAIDRDIPFYWYVVHDPDDYSHPDRFKLAQWLFDKIEDVLVVYQMYVRTQWETGEVLRYVPGVGCAFYSRKIFDILGYYDNTLRFAGDTEYDARFKLYEKYRGKGPHYYNRRLEYDPTKPDQQPLLTAYYDNTNSNLTVLHPFESPERGKVREYTNRIQQFDITDLEQIYYPFNNKGWRH